MDSFYLILLAMILFAVIRGMLQRRRIAAVSHIINRKKQNKEDVLMKELAKQFIGKECLIYTIASDYNTVKGTLKEVTDNGLLIECGGNMQAVNLEFVTRICEWPRKKNGKKKEIISD